MRFKAFRAGHREGLSTSNKDRSDVAEWAADAFYYLPGPVTALVETQLVQLATKISHIHARREKKEPGTVFYCALTETEFREFERATAAQARERKAKIRAEIKNLKRKTAKIIHWDDLTPKMQARFVGRDLAPDVCWWWQPLPHRARGAEQSQAPYKDFYQKVHGLTVSPGVYLRHRCDNRLCMNPNHLVPGTARENTQDMLERGRHYRQVEARIRAKRRARYLRWKKRQSERRREAISRLALDRLALE